MGTELPASTPYQPLKGEKIVFGLTASAAVYKSIDLMRLLMKRGASVRVVMTKKACRLIGRDLVEWAVGEKPVVEESGKAEHIEFTEWGDAMVIAPATLNTLAKVAYGIGDEIVSLTAIAFMGSGKKVIVVPTMNLKLYDSPQCRESLKILSSMGVAIIPPHIEEGKAKFPPLDDVAHCIDAIVNRGVDLRGRKVLVTTGATVEFVDPVRVITNLSSGLMGVLVAREAMCRGAEVTLVYGKVSVEMPYAIKGVKVLTTEDMAKAVESLTEREEFDAAVFAAAPADFKPSTSLQHKVSTRSVTKLTLELVPTEKVATRVRKRPRVMVGFSAETSPIDQIANYVKMKMNSLGFDMVIAHNVTTPATGFSEESLDAWLVTDKEIRRLGVMRKEEVARLIVDKISMLLKQ